MAIIINIDDAGKKENERDRTFGAGWNHDG